MMMMRHHWILWVGFSFLCWQGWIPLVSAMEPLPLEKISLGVQAKGALLVDAQSGRILFSRNPDTQFSPASTVKLMTALLTYEKTGLEGRVKIRSEDTKAEPSNIPLMNGEVVSINTLVHSILIASDNDSALALARFVSGNVPTFISIMNQRARELGCQNTTFKNPNGLPVQGQLTTARDLLKIFQKVLSIPALRMICGKKDYSITTARGAQMLKNHNKLLGIYPGMGPAKTGWTYSSRHTYAAAASRNGHELHLIILNSSNKWTDASLLFDYGFQKLAVTSIQAEKQSNGKGKANSIN